ncbi:hypothetical protein A2U01_0109228, partial [Trifolium medium]|nr:hypothetical protein [Trifolium medium]
DEDGGKNSPAGTSGRGTRKLPPHILRPVDIPNIEDNELMNTSF